MTLILNTWIFEEAVQHGISQSDLVDRVAKLGADGFSNLQTELPAVAKRAQTNRMIVNYSVPDDLFTKSGELNPNLQGYLDEGRVMGVNKIKFNTGHFDRFSGDLSETLGQLRLGDMELNVENDQTPVSGTVTAIKTFLKASTKAGFDKIGYVYDLGNWAFTHGDAIASADELRSKTHYIHLKNTREDGGELKTTDNLDVGIYDWRDLLHHHLPQNVMIALEYPMVSDEQIRSQIALVKSEVGE